MILDANQLASIRQHNDEELRRGGRGTHGYPAQTILNLLHTVEALKKEKKKWKKLAQDRGKSLGMIKDIASE
ncbi:hypothetical protein GKC30_12950 [Pseudodesulfovibrio sp. F-1]|uniref:Uncharacterized protein n=1 Tax=Pseudodesulfovibrio alkaliphilus TaxID=2661613 RepID=A0A7K1KR17_9BACT|nr:hypothetical protein [Pseudodesulfovibrio alkaliphilus]MUM78545.1 hypothetical protein [Pseudodesulfovibrio alkaliphilus]